VMSEEDDEGGGERGKSKDLLNMWNELNCF
jgi:hypothetical protein